MVSLNFDFTQSELDREQLLAQLTTQIHASLDLPTVLSTTVTGVRSFLQCDRVLVYQFRPDWSGWVVAESVGEGWTASLHNRLEDTCFQEQASTLYGTGRTIVVDDIYAEGYTDCHLRLLEQYQVKANLVVPILVSGQLWGLLISHHCQSRHPWQPADIILLERIALKFAIAVQQATAYQQVTTELAARQQAESLLELQNTILKRVVRAEPLDEILEELIQAIEGHLEGALCSIMLCDEENRLRHGIAPHLPEDYRQAIDGIAIGEGVGSCGTALARRDLVIVPDIANDPLWADYRDFALSYGLRACWSSPIKTSHDRVLGAFGVYYQECREPKPRDLEILAIATNLAGIAIERAQAAQAIIKLNQELECKVVERTSAHDRLLNFLDVSLNEIYVFDAETLRFDYVNRGAVNNLGYSLAVLKTMTPLAIKPDFTEAELRQLLQPLLDGSRSELVLETRHQRADRSFYPVEAHIQCHQYQNKSFFLAVILDISDRQTAARETQSLKERLQFVLATSPAVIYTCKAEGDYGCTFISKNVEHILGYTAEAWQAETGFWLKRLHPEDAPHILAKLPTLFEQGHHVHEYRFLHQAGHYCWLRDELRLVRDDQGQPIEIVGYFADISDRKQAELALKASKQQYKTLVANSPEIIERFDLQGRYLYVSPSLTRILGLPFQSFLGKTYRELNFAEPMVNIWEAAAQRLLATGEAQNLEFSAPTLQGERSFEMLMVPELNPENELVSILCVSRDVTEHKQNEAALAQQAEREKLLAAITQRIRQSLDLKDILNTTVAEVHQLLQADRVLVYRILPNFTGQTIAESVSPGWPAILEMIFPEEIFPRENYDRYVQGRVFALTDRETEPVLPCLVDFLRDLKVRAKLVVPIVENDALWGLLIAHQCLVPRQWQPWEINLLRQLSGQLAIAIHQSELYAQLQASHQHATHINAELIRATRLKDEFLANMSHELRTPLNAILGLSEGLQDGVFGAINDRQLQSILTIERSGQHLLDLITDILDVSKIEAGKLELELKATSIEYLCKSSLVFVKQQALKKQIQLEAIVADNLGEIAVDERRIRQVLINLLNNAVKFTPAGGRITLEAYREPIQVNLADRVPIRRVNIAFDWQADLQDHHSLENQYYLCIAITDTGIGISQADQAKLFQPFVQVDSSLNRQYEGTGLGLTLVKQIVELHGGSINLHSEPGQGSCFTVQLPYVCQGRGDANPPLQSDHVLGTSSSPGFDSGAESIVQAEASAERHQSPLILLAEDNQGNLDTFMGYLEARGYRLIVANDGQAAIERAKQHHPDLILMDIQMPGTDGLTAIRHIRQDEQLTQTPIIAVTALAMNGDRARCLEAGANDYLAKPVSLKQLAGTIQHWLSQLNSDDAT